MFGMKTLPYISYLAKQVGKGVPYLSTTLKVVPLIAPEYGEPTMAVDNSLGMVSMGIQAAPYKANKTSTVAQMLDNVLHVGSFGVFFKKKQHLDITQWNKLLNIILILKGDRR